MTWAIKELLDGEEITKTVSEFCKRILLLAIAVVAYVLITLLLLKITNNGVDLFLGRTDGEESVSLLHRLVNVFLYFVGYLWQGTAGLIPTGISMVAHTVAMLLVIYLLIHFIGSWTKHRIVISIGSLFLLVCAINSIILLSGGAHTLMVYSFTTVYIVAAMLVEKETLRAGQNAGCRLSKMPIKILKASLILIVVANVYIANHVYLKMVYEDSNLYSFYTTMVSRIETCHGFSEGDRIAIVGDTDELVWDFAEFPRCSIVGTNDIDKNIYSKAQFIKYYIGADFDFLNLQEREELIDENREKFDAMATYPYDGSVQKVGDVIVVKFGDISDEQ